MLKLFEWLLLYRGLWYLMKVGSLLSLFTVFLRCTDQYDAKTHIEIKLRHLISGLRLYFLAVFVFVLKWSNIEYPEALKTLPISKARSTFLTQNSINPKYQENLFFNPIVKSLTLIE